jgi:hypothetical protein
MRLLRLVPVALVLGLATACSGGVEALPDDEAFTSCLESAGVDPDSADDEDGRRDAFSEPAALDCVLDLDDLDERRAVLGGVFTDEQLWPVLQDWVATRTEAAEVVAREAGELLAATDDGDDDEQGEGWAKEQVHENLALVIYEQAAGPPASYQTWLDDPDAQQSVSDSDPLSAGSQYLNWLEDPANGDQQTAQEIRRLQDTIRETREG